MHCEIFLFPVTQQFCESYPFIHRLITALCVSVPLPLGTLTYLLPHQLHLPPASPPSCIMFPSSNLPHIHLLPVASPFPPTDLPHVPHLLSLPLASPSLNNFKLAPIPPPLLCLAHIPPPLARSLPPLPWSRPGRCPAGRVPSGRLPAPS